MKTQISKTAQDFLKYNFTGNGKYRTTEYGSKAFRQTGFSKFLKNNSDCINIIEHGNDAQKGGRVGSFVFVEFNENFYSKYGSFLANLKEIEEKRIALEAKKAENNIIQKQQLADLFAKDNSFKIKIQDFINTRSSKEWRSIVKMKVAQKLTNESFTNLSLSPVEIRELAFN